MRAAFLVLSLALLACSSDSDDPAPQPSGQAGGTGAPAAAEGGYDEAPVGGDRPAQVYVPKGYRADTAAPLVVLLHGFGASGKAQELLFQLKAVADERVFLYVHPDGTFDEGETGSKKRFWNATDACCNFGNKPVDDSAYLRGLIDEIKKRYAVDGKRVYVMGHSNGGFMSYRMACDHADVVAGIASLAGATFGDMSKCNPSQPVSVLQIHGTKDADVKYEGESSPGFSFPGAVGTAEAWAKLNGCAVEPDRSAAPLDLDSGLAGAESTVARYTSGCKPGGQVELWTIVDGQHVPAVNDTFRKGVIDWLLAHPKP